MEFSGPELKQVVGPIDLFIFLKKRLSECQATYKCLDTFRKSKKDKDLNYYIMRLHGKKLVEMLHYLW